MLRHRNNNVNTRAHMRTYTFHFKHKSYSKTRVGVPQDMLHVFACRNVVEKSGKNRRPRWSQVTRRLKTLAESLNLSD
jgi:hypothetical protein